jgi:hypothetical protein
MCALRYGLLIYDNVGDIGERILRAEAAYKRKFGLAPDVAYVHKSELGNDETAAAWVGNIRVKAHRAALPFHILIGEEEKDGVVHD